MCGNIRLVTGRCKVLWCKDLGRWGPGADGVSPYTVKTYKNCIYIFAINDCLYVNMYSVQKYFENSSEFS